MPVSYKLSKMPQRDFLNIFYSGFYDPEVEFEPVGDMKKEVESTKLKIQQISKIKDEIDKTISKMNDTKRTLDAQKRKMYQEGVRKNVRKVYDMQFKLYKSMQKYSLTSAELGNMRGERTFQKSNYDPNELLEYFDNIKHYQKHARELLGIDMIEARAIYNRVGVFSICEMSEILASYKLRGQLDKVKNILEFPLIREKRVREFVDTVEAIALFSNRFFFDGIQVTKKSSEESEDGDEKEDRNANKRSKKEEKEAKNAQADNFDNFFKFFPFWDTKFCEGSREDSVFVRKQLDINVVDSYNLSQVMRCETLREMVESYQLNREQQNIPSFTQEEMAKLEQRGLDRLKAERVRSLITFLAKQARAIPSALFNFLGCDKKMYKIDMRGIENVGRLACIAAIFACVLNLQHPLTRVDISGFGCDEDIGSVISLLIRNKRIAIKELQLNGNKLEATGFNQLYKVTSKQANKIPISVFSMNSVSLPLESSLLLPTFVKKADFLRILSLEGNQLQDNIGSLILEFIATSRNLKYINLSDNGLGDKSLEKLITVITKNQLIECIEYEHNLISETRVEMLLDCFRECKTSNLRVLKLGMIQKTANDYSLMFRTGFSFFPKLALGTITIHADLKDQEMSLTTILQENRCLYIINNFTQNHLRSYQSAALNFFTEQLLLAESPKEELLGIYRPLIETFEQKNDIVLMDNMEHLWPKFKSTPIQDSLTKETKETLLCRYLLALASENYAGIVQLELIYLCLKYLVSLQVCFQDGFNLLHKIIVSRNTLLLEECFKVGMSLNIPTFETNTLIPRMTTLQLILLTKNEEMLTRMLTYKPNVDETDAYGNTLLHYVCLYGMEKLCRRLIELECKCDAENSLGMMALHTAILGNSFGCFMIVLNQLGRNTMNDNYAIKQIGTIKQNCLHLSVIYNCSAVFEYCLEVLEDLNVQDAVGKTALMYAVEKGNKFFMMRLMASKVNLFVMDNNKDNLLMYLLAKRDEETFKKILAMYDNQIALYKNSKGEDLLYAAAKYNVPNVVKHFLELGISPNEPNMNGVCAKDLIEKNPMLVKEFYKWKSNSQSADATQMQNLTNDSISLPNKRDGSQGDRGNRSILKAGKSNGSSGKIDKTVIVGGSMNKSLDKSLNVSRVPKKLPTSEQNKDYEFILPKLNPGTLHGTINRGALFVDEKGYWGTEWKDSTANIMKDINSETKKKTYYDLIEEYQRKKRAGQKVDFAKIKSEFDKQIGVQKSTDIYRYDARKSIMGLPNTGDRKSVLRSRLPRPGSPGTVDKSNVKWWDSQNRGNSGAGKAAQNRTFDSRDYSRGGSRSPDRQNRSMNA